MALYMPTNITPSTLGDIGNGVVDAWDGITVSWQVNGQDALVAFEIKIMQNSESSTVLFDTGRISDGCPFYGRDASGDVQLFSYQIPYSSLAAANIVNGGTYKLSITQWWSAAESVTQRSASVFECRDAPTLTITPFSKPVNTWAKTWTATYKQTQGDAFISARWMLALSDEKDAPLYDTGSIQTVQLQFSYDGLFTGQTYAIRCLAETENGVVADSGWVEFEVSYNVPGYSGVVTALCCRKESGVKVSWPGAYAIPGTATGDFSIENGHLILHRPASGTNAVYWEKVNGEAMRFTPGMSVVWRGRIKEFPQQLFSFVREGTLSDGTAASIETKVSLNETVFSVTVTKTEANGTRSETATYSQSLLDEDIPSYFGLGDEITAVFLPNGPGFIYNDFGALFPSLTLYPSETLYPAREYHSAWWLKLSITSFITNEPVERISMQAELDCDYLWITSGVLNNETLYALMRGKEYTPQFGAQTLFLADFTDGLEAGAITGLSENDKLTMWRVYRVEEATRSFRPVAQLPISEKSVIDCAARSQGTYSYAIFGITEAQQTTGSLTSNTVDVYLWDWTLLQCQETAENTFEVDRLFRFSLNVASGSVGNNNRPNVLGNFTRYPTVQIDPANYQSGTLSAYLGEVGAGGEYADTIAKRDALFALSTSGEPVFLKNRKGDLMRVAMRDGINVQTQDATRQQALVCSVPWCEIGSAENALIVLRSSSELWPTK